MAFFIPSSDVPRRLRAWFVVHFILDIVTAVPLLVAPREFALLLGFPAVDPLTSRLVAAALVAIGVESLLSRNATRENFRTLLRLKVLWSAAAGVGTLVTIAGGAPRAAWAVLAIFAAFNALWLRYLLLLRRAGSAGA